MNKIKFTLAVMVLLSSFSTVFAEPQKASVNSNQNITADSSDSSITYSSRASNKFMKKDMNGAIEDLTQAIK